MGAGKHQLVSGVGHLRGGYFLPVGGFFSGVSLGKRQGVCPLYPALCVVFVLVFVRMACFFSNMADEMLVLIAVFSTLGGNVLGWMYRRAVPKKET